MILGQNSASTQPAIFASLRRENGHCHATLQEEPATDIMFEAAKKLMDFVPRVPQTDAI